MASRYQPNTSTRTLTTLAAIEVSGLVLGTFCYVLSEEQPYILKIGGDVPSPDVDGTGWSIFAGGNGHTPYFPSKTITVKVDGNDDNDGVVAPVKTLTRAVTLVQEQLGGTILAEDFVWASPVEGAGLKLRNPLVDRGIGGSGWQDVSYPITFQFQGNPERQAQGWGTSYIAPGGGADHALEPVLWLAGTSSSIIVNNCQLWSDAGPVVPTVRLGLSSPLAAWDIGTSYFRLSAVTFGGKPYCSLGEPNIGHQPDISPSFWRIARADSVNGDLLAPTDTTLVYFDQCQFTRVGFDKGPALDVGLGFWNYYNKCLFAKFNFSADPGTESPELNCAVRMMATARGAPYLQYFSQAQFDGAGIYTTGNSAGIIQTASMEDAIFPMLAAYDDPDVNATSTSLRWDLFNCDVSDGPFGETRAADNQSNGIIYTDRCQRSTGRVVERNPLNPADEPTDRLTYGFSGPTLLLQHDSARRGYGPVSAGYPNVAWGAPTGATLGIAPDGTNTAFEAGAVTHTMFDESTPPQVLADGDRLIFGINNRWDTGGGGVGNYVQNTGAGAITIFVGGFAAGANQERTLAPGEFYRWLGDVPSSFGMWAWQWGWLKVITKGTGEITITANTDTDGFLWRPSAQIIPASDTLTKTPEAAYLAMLGSAPANFRKFGAPDTILSPTAGTVAMWPGQKFAFFDATLGVWKYMDIDNGAVRIT